MESIKSDIFRNDWEARLLKIKKDKDKKAKELIKKAKNPIVLIGFGAARRHAAKEVKKFVEHIGAPAACTFMAKGVLSDKHEQMLGVVGFMHKDYEIGRAHV